MSQLRFSIPRAGEPDLEFCLDAGNVLYMLGANGSGKSSLISRLFTLHAAVAKRISAHRQTWFPSNAVDMTPQRREEFGRNIRAQDAQEHARYLLEYGAQRASVAIFDLIDADAMLARKIADLVRAGNIPKAEKAATEPAPIQVVNELMRLSNIPIEIRLQDGQKVIAKKNGSASYSVAELSDGERNAFLVAADVLTAKPGSLLLIDEPERHLHRSIISPLLRQLFAKRSDCTFIVSTHEPMLPLDTPEARTLLVRACEYLDSHVKSWTVDMLESDVPVDEELKRDILGSRRKILFVEGTGQSLDVPLYSLIFPQISIIPKEGCRNVEQAVRGLRGTHQMHWVSAWGIVDNDQRTLEEINRLRTTNVWTLSHYSVESFYYHPKIIEKIATRQAALTGIDAEVLISDALSCAINAAQQQRDHLITSTILRSARQSMLSNLPTRDDINGKELVAIRVDIADLRSKEEIYFETAIADRNWNSLLTRYPLRESSALSCIARGLKLPDKKTYQGAVLKLLQDDSSAIECLRNLLNGLYEEVSK